MIFVTRFDGSEFVINSDLIETVEATPDTVVTFSKDKKVVVEFGRQPPEFPPCEGLVSDWEVGTRRELVFAGYGPRQRAAVEALQPVHVEVPHPVLQAVDHQAAHHRVLGAELVPGARAVHVVLLVRREPVIVEDVPLVRERPPPRTQPRQHLPRTDLINIYS